jgi:hypothetical protein
MKKTPSLLNEKPNKIILKNEIEYTNQYLILEITPLQ